MQGLEKIDSFITSQPSRIVKTFLNLSSNDLGRHLRITCIETLVGFSLGTIMGVIIAIILWWSSFISKVSEPFLVILNATIKSSTRTSNNNMVGAGMPAIIVMALANFAYCNNIKYFKWTYKTQIKEKNKNG